MILSEEVKHVVKYVRGQRANWNPKPGFIAWLSRLVRDVTRRDATKLMTRHSHADFHEAQSITYDSTLLTTLRDTMGKTRNWAQDNTFWILLRKKISWRRDRQKMPALQSRPLLSTFSLAAIVPTALWFIFRPLMEPVPALPALYTSFGLSIIACLSTLYLVPVLGPLFIKVGLKGRDRAKVYSDDM